MARVYILFILYPLWIHVFDLAVAQSGKCPSRSCANYNGNCVQCINNANSADKCSYWPRKGICDSTQFLWSQCRSTPGCNTDEIVSDEYDCPKSSSNSFDHNFASQKMLLLAAAAYGDHHNTEQCLLGHLGDFRLIGTYSYTCHGALWFKTNCYGFIAVSKARHAIVISFRGTAGTIQLYKEYSKRNEKNPFPGGGRVSTYFYQTFLSLWQNVISIGEINGTMNSAVDRLRLDYTDYELWVTGHSLGGAIASICATYIMSEHPTWFPTNAIKLVTFGQPRTGDKTFAKLHDQLVPYSFRIINRKDMVAQVPPRAPESNVLSSKTCCHGCGNEENYHHSNEVWYENGIGGTAKECKQPESWDCSIGTFYETCSVWSEYSVYDHLCYYGHCVGEWGKDGCSSGHTCSNSQTCSLLKYLENY